MAELSGSTGFMSALFGGGVGGVAGGLFGWLTWQPLCAERLRRSDLSHLYQRDCPVIGPVDFEQWLLFTAAGGGVLLFLVQAFRWASR